MDKWKETSGTPLMYNGQGKYSREQPNDRMEYRVERQRELEMESYRVGGGGRSGAEQLLKEPTACAKPLESKEPPVAPRSQVSVAMTSNTAVLSQHPSHTLAPQSNTAGPQLPSIAAEEVLQLLGYSQTKPVSPSEDIGLQPPS